MGEESIKLQPEATLSTRNAIQTKLNSHQA